MPSHESTPSNRYRAFISYSQKDKAAARRLHKWLETYRVPMGVMGTVDLAPKGRLGRFFRDDEEMSAAADIAATVRGAIEDSQALIVICSPRSAKSKWVNAEIQHFRKSGRADQVFAIIIDGTPNSGNEKTECFPPALRVAGDPDDPNAMPIEPLGLDLRKDGKPRILTRLAAALLGLDFDTLWQRERRRLRTRKTFAGLGVGVVAAAALFTTTLFVREAAIKDAVALQTAAADVSENAEQATRINLLAATDSILSPAPRGAAFRLGANTAKMATASAFSVPGETTLAFTFSSENVARLVTVSGEQASSIIPAGSAKVWALGPDGIWTSIGLENSETVRQAAFSRTGNELVTLSADNAVAVWTLAEDGTWDAKQLPDLVIPIGWVRFSRNGKHIVSHEDGNRIQLWRRDDAGDWSTEILEETHGYKILDAQFSPDGESLVTVAGGDNTTRIWARDDEGGWAYEVFDTPGVAYAAQFSPWGDRIVVSSDNYLSLWEKTDDGSWLSSASLDSHTDKITDVHFFKQDQIISTSEDGTARWWSEKDGAWTAQILAGSGADMLSAALHASTNLLATVSGDGTTQVWQNPWGRASLVQTFQTTDNIGWRSKVQFSPDGQRLYNGDAKSRIYDLSESRSKGALPSQDLSIFENPTMLLSADRQHMVIAAMSGEGQAFELNAENIWQARYDFSVDHNVYDGALSRDGRRVAFSGEQGALSLFELGHESPSDPLSLEGHADAIVELDFSPDGNRIVTGSQDGTARIWQHIGDRDWESKVLFELPSSRFQRFVTVEYAPKRDDVLITSTRGDTVLLSEADSGAWSQTKISSNGGYGSATFSPDGNRFALLSEGDVASGIWNRGSDGSWSPEPIDVLSANKRGLIRFSPDGKDLYVTPFSSSRPQVITRDQTRTWVSQPLIGHTIEPGQTSRVVDADLGSNRLLTTGSDGTARLWARDHDGAWLSHPIGHTPQRYGFTGAAFSIDGSQVVLIPRNSNIRTPEPIRLVDVTSLSSSHSGSSPTAAACAALRRSAIERIDSETGATVLEYPLAQLVRADFEAAPTLTKLGLNPGDDVCDFISQTQWDDVPSSLLPRALWALD